MTDQSKIPQDPRPTRPLIGFVGLATQTLIVRRHTLTGEILVEWNIHADGDLVRFGIGRTLQPELEVIGAVLDDLLSQATAQDQGGGS